MPARSDWHPRFGSMVVSTTLAPHFITYVHSLGSAQSGLAMCNPNNSSVNVTFNLRNTSGQIVASATKTLAALGHAAQFFTQLFPAGFEQFEGTLEVMTAGSSIIAVSFRYDNPGGTVFAALPVIPIP